METITCIVVVLIAAVIGVAAGVLISNAYFKRDGSYKWRGAFSLRFANKQRFWLNLPLDNKKVEHESIPSDIDLTDVILHHAYAGALPIVLIELNGHP